MDETCNDCERADVELLDVTVTRPDGTKYNVVLCEECTKVLENGTYLVN